MKSTSLPPIERSITVAWPPEEAFRRFVHQFADWWPRATHSIGGKRVKRIVLEPLVGGRIFEEHQDGRRFQWGRILELEEGRRLKFNFHPSRDASTAQTVELQFAAVPEGTRLTLTATGWENWGKGASRARQGYGMGWSYILRLWAGQRTAGMLAIDGLGWIGRAVQFVRGGTAAAVNRAGGEIPGA
jgi:hypothetical protein